MTNMGGMVQSTAIMTCGTSSVVPQAGQWVDLSFWLCEFDPHPEHDLVKLDRLCSSFL